MRQYKLNASSADRWINCPASPRLSENAPKFDSPFAIEGSAAHALAEKCLRTGQDAATYEGYFITFKDREARFTANEPEIDPAVEVCADMVSAVQIYLDWANTIIEEGDEVFIEQKFTLTELYPTFSGMADLVIYKPAKKLLIVADYKHGRGVPVEAKENPQLRYYALGIAYKKQLEKIGIYVIQPRCPHPDGPIRYEEVSAFELLEWSFTLVNAAKRTEDQNASANPGDWCKFCPAAATCPALEKKAHEAACAAFTEAGDIVLSEPTTFSHERMARLLKDVDLIEDWCQRVREYAHHELEAGRKIEGYKLVASRPQRKFKDEVQVSYAINDFIIENKLPVSQISLHQPGKFKSPAQMEATLKKELGLKPAQVKELLNPLIESVSKGTVVVPEEDPRPPVRAEAETVFDTVDPEAIS